MKRADRRDRWGEILALASAVSLIASGCATPAPAASSLAAATSSAPTAAPSPTAPTTPSPTRAPTTAPIPTLPSTTKDATVAPAGAISIKMVDEPGPRFMPAQVTAKSGTVVFFLQNVRGPIFPVEHNMAIGPQLHKGFAASTFIHADKSAVFTVDGLAPGTYAFWCQVKDHVANGMVGTLTITP